VFLSALPLFFICSFFVVIPNQHYLFAEI